MTREKQTSVKILTSAKKKRPAPMLYAVGGFCVGILLTSSIAFTYFFIQQKNTSLQVNQNPAVDQTTAIDNEMPTREPEAIFEASKVNASNQPQATSDPESSTEFIQPKDDELSKAFLRRPQALTTALPKPTTNAISQNKENKNQNTSPRSSVHSQKQSPQKITRPQQSLDIPEESPVGDVQTTITTRAVETKHVALTTP
ncbi:hypothetical protein [Acinetobacter sp. SWAC57]|uniref:hypothetical protein n=1 Tax=Acinetobacter sp. SWAC57 TaxID=2293834 RepID=UPI000E5C49A3|nr:hypothetical protein [Acinetobacter sp. SWAC57]RGD90117.1 hypothetical protein DYI96_11405 [Acinetobacter sp. SWAC57]